MGSYEIGAALIVLFGLSLMAASAPMVRFGGRNTMIVSQFGDGMVKWLTRGFGFVVCVLGIVTLLQR